MEDTDGEFEVRVCDLSLGFLPGDEVSHNVLGEIIFPDDGMHIIGVQGSQVNYVMILKYTWNGGRPREDKNYTHISRDFLIDVDYGVEKNKFRDTYGSGVHVCG